MPTIEPAVYKWCECGHALEYEEWAREQCAVCLRRLRPERDPADDTMVVMEPAATGHQCIRCGEFFGDMDRQVCEVCRGMDSGINEE